MDNLSSELISLVNIIIIDVVLAGDNAIIVGLAASRVAPELRTRVIYWGILGAVVLRIMFAAVTTQLLAIVGLTLAGGLLLLWVCWKMYREVRRGHHSAPDHASATSSNGEAAPPSGYLAFWPAVTQVVLADVTMSLDNVLAVAGAAKGSTWVLVVGLAIAIVLMAIASRYIAELLVRHPWITWIGLAVIVFVAFDMIYDGGHEVACRAIGQAWCEENHLLKALWRALFGR